MIYTCIFDPPQLFVFAPFFYKVIEEIEEMMQESPDPDDDEMPTQSDHLSLLSQDQTLKGSGANHNYEESKEHSLLCVYLVVVVHNFYTEILIVPMNGGSGKKIRT